MKRSQSEGISDCATFLMCAGNPESIVIVEGAWSTKSSKVTSDVVINPNNLIASEPLVAVEL